jgi:ATP-dependent RNA helicase RhlE
LTLKAALRAIVKFWQRAVVLFCFFWEGFMSFAALNLSESLLRAVREAEYDTATPIQTEAIPPILAGRDVLGCAQTGTGKTAAFALPTLQRLCGQAPAERFRPIRALVLAPTRELASQIADSFRTYGRYTGLRHAVIFGGVGQQPQVKALQRGVDILVATPGRLLDLMNQGFVDLSRVETLILDEADQMLDMGFIHDLRRIVSRVPRQRQTLLFSATMPAEIRRLADQWLQKPVEVSVAANSAPAERIDQSIYFVDRGNKPQLLAHYLREQRAERALVFIRTKHGADKLVRTLNRAGIRAEAIHGNKSQNARQRALAQFKSQRPPVLVATDIAARGLDIDGVSHVINFDLPMAAESYVHRIGRTARAGASGTAVTFCDREERGMVRQIERLTRQRLNVASHDFTNENESSPSADHAAETAGHQRARSTGRPAHSSHKRFGQSRQQQSRQKTPRQASRTDQTKHFSRRLSAV